MNETLWAVLIASVVGPSLLFALSRVFGGRRKDRVEADATLSDRWEKWANNLEREVKELRAEVKELRDELEAERSKNQRQGSLMTALISWALQLRDEVLKLGGHPPPAPPEVQAALTSLDPT